MRHCGNCGASFEPGTLVNSRCPSCGATIDSTGDILRTADIVKIDTLPVPGPYPPGPPRTSGDRGDGPGTSAAGRVMVRVDPHNVVVLDQRTSPGTNLILTLLALAALLLLIGGAALAGVKWSQSQQPTAPAAPASSSTASSGSPVVATPTSLAAVTATAGGPPTLSVAPTQFSRLTCVAASVQFQVLNSGGGSLAWIANASDSHYHLSPASGSLAHNEQQTVTVSMISLSGSITITALGAQNSPQTVTISCTV